MEPKYAEWIVANVPDPVGRCVEATAAMVAAFPELKRVRGHVYNVVWGEREHWWAVTPDGSVVDPTAGQFPNGISYYEPWDESVPEPTGKCPNCGGYCFDGKYCCSDACEASYVAYCNNPGAW